MTTSLLARGNRLFGVSGRDRQDDLADLILGRPDDATALAALAIRNANTIGAAIRSAIMTSAKRISLPEGDLVVGSQTSPGFAKRPSIYVTGTQDFFVHLNDTNLWVAGTDRTNVSGVAMWEACRGTCGFSGSGSIDYVNPQFAQGIVKQVLGPGRFVVALDERISWVDVCNCVIYDPARRCYVSRPFYAKSIPANLPGIPIVSLNAWSTDYLVDCTTQACAFFDGNAILPGVELVLMHYNGENLVDGIDTDRVVLPASLRIHGAPNAVFYGQNCSLEFDAHVEPTLVTSAIPARGRFRRRMCASGGLLFTPTELASTIGGTIIGVGDDAIDFVNHVSGVVSRDSNHVLTIAISQNRATAPKAGQTVTLTDAGRVKRFEGVVQAVSTSGSDAVLSFSPLVKLPLEVDADWEVENASPNRSVVIKDECRIELTASAGIRGSGQDIRIGNCFVAETMGPALMISDAGKTEFAPASLITIGHLLLRNPNCGLGFERFAGVTIRPRLNDGRTLAATGTFSTVDIASINIVGTCEGPALAAGAISSLRVGSLHAHLLNAHPTPFGDLPAGAAVQLENVSVARFGSIEVDGGHKSTIGCRRVDRLILSPLCWVFTPISGVGTLEIDALGDIPIVNPK